MFDGGKIKPRTPTIMKNKITSRLDEHWMNKKLCLPSFPDLNPIFNSIWTHQIGINKIIYYMKKKWMMELKKKPSNSLILDSGKIWPKSDKDRKQKIEILR